MKINWWKLIEENQLMKINWSELIDENQLIQMNWWKSIDPNEFMKMNWWKSNFKIDFDQSISYIENRLSDPYIDLALIKYVKLIKIFYLSIIECVLIQEWQVAENASIYVYGTWLESRIVEIGLKVRKRYFWFSSISISFFEHPKLQCILLTKKRIELAFQLFYGVLQS